MGNPFQIKSPIDGSLIDAGQYLTTDEALAQLALAETVQKQFRNSYITDRVALCRRFLDAFDEVADDNAREVSRAMGKPFSQARAEIKGMRERVEALCWQAPVALADQGLSPKADSERFIRREPLGVVLDIAAWNYPYVVAINVVVPAILAGNAVLLKHAAQTAVVGRQLERAFLAAGAPNGLMQSLMVEHDTVQELLATRRIHHVGFTGSVRGGREVYARVAATAFASCGLEMGGKDAAIVLDDADIGETARALADGAFYNAGQSCCAVERIYVPEHLHDAFVEALVAETHRLKVGNPLTSGTTLGPVVSSEAASRIRKQIEDAVAAGAKVASNDARFVLPSESDCYLPPRVLTGVNHSMSIMNEETFGPAVGVMAYRDEAEAIALANDSLYGLTASVWTKDSERALRVGDQLEVGTVYMNRCDAVDPDLPWSGVKDSGLGCTLSHLGIVALTRPKSYNLRVK